MDQPRVVGRGVPGRGLSAGGHHRAGAAQARVCAGHHDRRLCGRAPQGGRRHRGLRRHPGNGRRFAVRADLRTPADVHGTLLCAVAGHPRPEGDASGGCLVAGASLCRVDQRSRRLSRRGRAAGRGGTGRGGARVWPRRQPARPAGHPIRISGGSRAVGAGGYAGEPLRSWPVALFAQDRGRCSPRDRRVATAGHL